MNKNEFCSLGLRIHCTEETSDLARMWSGFSTTRKTLCISFIPITAKQIHRQLSTTQRPSAGGPMDSATPRVLRWRTQGRGWRYGHHWSHSSDGECTVCDRSTWDTHPRAHLEEEDTHMEGSAESPRRPQESLDSPLDTLLLLVPIPAFCTSPLPPAAVTNCVR